MSADLVVVSLSADVGDKAVQGNTRDTVVVLTALDLECRAVLARLTDVAAQRHEMGTIFQVGHRPGHAGDVVVAITGAGNQGAAVIAERAIATFAPRALLFVGVAGALHDDLALGDIVIGTKIYAYHGGLDQASGFHARPQAWEAPHALDQLAHYLEQQDRLSGLLDPRPNGARPAVWFRPIAAGEVVLNSRDTTLAAQLNRYYSDAAAIEMESAGTAKAAQLNDRLPMLTVRGISDKADGNKHSADKAGYQTVAANAAAAVAMVLIDELLDDAVTRPSAGRSVRDSAQSVTDGGGNSFGGADGARGSLRPPCRAGRVPPRADQFQERALAAELAHTLSGGQVAVLTSDSPAVRASVLSGLGGVGKTQLAADHAENAWAAGELDLLIWINAATRDNIVAEYARLATRLADVNDTAPDTAARLFMGWLATTPARWLIVLDDLQVPGDLTGLWPPECANGHVIVTTRRRDSALWGSSRRIIEVGLFTQAESTAYLAAKLHDRPRLAAGLDELAQTLGYLPLALSQAVAYMVDRDLSCADYLVRFQDRRRALSTLLPDRDALPDEHRDTVAATWSLSVELADQLEPRGLARPMLDLTALMDANGIPSAVLAVPVVLDYLSQTGRPDVTAEMAHDALTCLHRLSLVTFDRLSPHLTTRVHALVQRATRDQFDAHKWRALPGVVARALLEMWSGAGHDALLVQSLRVNTEALRLNAAARLWSSGAYQVLFRAGQSLGESGYVVSAFQYFQQLKSDAAYHLGQDHVDVLRVRQEAALWRKADGHNFHALDDFRALYRDQSRLLGPDHRDTLATQRYIIEIEGYRYGSLGMRTADLRRLAQDTVMILGPDDPLTLAVHSDLVRSHANSRGLGQARQDYEQVLASQTRVLGPHHRDTLMTRWYIASWQAEAGDPPRAVITMERLLVDQIQALGRDHPDVLATRRALAELRHKLVTRSGPGDVHHWQFVSNAGDLVPGAVWDTGRVQQQEYQDVQESLAQLVDDCARLLGTDHPDTLTAQQELDNWRTEANQHDIQVIHNLEAELATFEDTHHPGTFDLRDKLVSLYAKTGDMARAWGRLEQLYDAQIEAYGANSYRLEWTVRHLVWWRARMGNRAGSVDMLEELARLTSDTKVHDDLRYWRGDADDLVFDDIGELRRILADDLDKLGPDHRYTLATKYMLASRLGAAGQRNEAVAALRALLTEQIRVLGPHHRDITVTRGDLEWWQADQGK